MIDSYATGLRRKGGGGGKPQRVRRGRFPAPRACDVFERLRLRVGQRAVAACRSSTRTRPSGPPTPGSSVQAAHGYVHQSGDCDPTAPTVFPRGLGRQRSDDNCTGDRRRRAVWYGAATATGTRSHAHRPVLLESRRLRRPGGDSHSTPRISPGWPTSATARSHCCGASTSGPIGGPVDLLGRDGRAAPASCRNLDWKPPVCQKVRPVLAPYSFSGSIVWGRCPLAVSYQAAKTLDLTGANSSSTSPSIGYGDHSLITTTSYRELSRQRHFTAPSRDGRRSPRPPSIPSVVSAFTQMPWVAPGLLIGTGSNLSD